MATQDPIERVKRLKKELLVAEQANKLNETLNTKREELETYVQSIRNQIEKETLELHKKRAAQEQELSHLKNKIEEKQELLKMVKKSKLEMDTKLDNYEDFSLEVVDNLRQILVDAILESRPDQEASYRQLEQKLNNKKTLHQSMLDVEKDIDQISRHLQIVVEEREKVRRGSILRYIFGKNPNVVISMSLQSAYQLAEGGKKRLEQALKTTHNDKRLKILNEIKRTLAEVQEQTSKRWGFRSIDTLISPLDVKLTQLKVDLDDQTNFVSREVIELDARLSEWIDQMSQ